MRIFRTHKADDFDYDEQHSDNDYGKSPAVYDHDGEYSHDGYSRADELCHAVAEHFTDSVSVVGVETHKFAVSVFIEIAYGEHFHFAEQVITYTHKGSGGYLHHYALIKQ